MAGLKKKLRNECRGVGRAIGPDRFVSGNSYWQSHAVLETQESIVARSDDGLPRSSPPPYRRRFTSSFFLGRRFAIFQSPRTCLYSHIGYIELSAQN